MYDKLIKCFRSLYTCTVITLDNVNPARAGWFWGQCTCVHIVYQEGMFPVSSCGFNALRNEVSRPGVSTPSTLFQHLHSGMRHFVPSDGALHVH